MSDFFVKTFFSDRELVWFVSQLTIEFGLPIILLSHGEEFEERVRMASETAARIDLYVEVLCLEAVDRVVVEYFDVSVGRVQQQQQKQLEQQQPKQQQQLELQQLVQRQRERLNVHQNWEETLRVSENIMQERWAGRCRVCRGG